MISSLIGTITQKDSGSVTIRIGGLGLRVDVSSATLAALPKVGQEVELLTSLHLSDRDGFTLYGFGEVRERTLFLFLIEVPGVGPRGALTILSAASVDELEGAIAAGDEKLLTRVSGIGKKKAQKILIELKERYEGIGVQAGATDTVDVLDALRSMGYAEKEAREAVRALSSDAKTTEEKLREALRRLGK